MSLANSVERWTRSAHEIHCKFEGRFDSYLPITLSGISIAWNLPLWAEDDLDEAFSNPTQTREELRGFIAAFPDDMSVRWTILAFLYDLCLKRPNDIDDEDYNDEWEAEFHRDEARLPFREELATLVSLPDVEKILEAERLRWELHCSCLVENYQRAEACFHRLRAVEPSTAGETAALFGEFHLLGARSAHVEEISDAVFTFSQSTRMATSTGRWAIGVDEDASGAERSKLSDARYWFEKSTIEGFDLPQPYLAALARCFFIEENFRRAAVLFDECLSKGGLGLEGEQAVFNDELDAGLYLASARSHEFSDAKDRARILLEGCTQRFPKHGPAYRRLAELAITSEANYERACEALARWSDAEPELGQDIWVRTLRGVAGIKTNQSVARMLDEFFDAHPKRLDWVRNAVRSHWSGFSKLSDAAQKQWLYGCWILWWRPPGFESIEYADAGMRFALALEIEFRDRVFGRFIETVDLKAIKADLAWPRPDARGKSAWMRLLDGKGTLGDMLTECDPHKASTLAASATFREWLSKSFRTLVGNYSREEAIRLNQTRTTSVHIGEETRERVEESCRLCRTYLEYVLNVGASERP